VSDYYDLEFNLDDDRAQFPDDVIQAPLPPSREPDRHTLNEWRELRIADGICPMPGCAGSLDEDFYCSRCSNVSLPAPTRVEVERVTIPLPPHELPFDEYSPAVVDDEAA
jgi:hypothetical protein